MKTGKYSPPILNHKKERSHYADYDFNDFMPTNYIIRGPRNEDRSNSSLKKLDISSNTFGHPMMPLYCTLISCHNIIKLTLSNLHIGDTNVDCIAQALKHNMHLKSLGNIITQIFRSMSLVV
jgi:hypothetical protein